MADPIAALTEREKQTLRLLLDGHDAKSIARECGLSVHTINERLRDARRKLSVSSSREAARLLRAHDRTIPQMAGDEGIGAASPTASPDIRPRPGVPRPTHRRAAWAIGAVMIALTLILALSLSLPSPPSSLQADALPSAAASHRTDASNAALRFLVLIDAARWDESWAATGQAFQSLNDRAAWRAASLRARVPLGAVLSRQWLGEIDTPTPPAGTTTVRFTTDFANRKAAIETVSLAREAGAWKVVGVYIE